MKDKFATRAPSFNAPASHGFAVTAHDTADLPEITRALYIGGTGDIAVTLASGASVTFENVAAGTLLPVRAARVLETGTSATAIVGLS